MSAKDIKLCSDCDKRPVFGDEYCTLCKVCLMDEMWSGYPEYEDERAQRHEDDHKNRGQ
jgi:hypothetical protein